MRKIIIISILFLFIFLIGSCSDGSSATQNQIIGVGSSGISSLEDIVCDMSVFSHLKTNINSDTIAVGLQQVSYAPTRGLDSYLDAIIVKQDKGEESEPIQFEVVTSVDENGNKIVGFDGKTLNEGDIITQGIIPGKVDKLYVGVDFTFISYITVDAYKLFNSINTIESVDGLGNTYFAGREDFDFYSTNTGGHASSLNWCYYPENRSEDGAQYIGINYESSEWFYDSEGRRQTSTKLENEHITFRDLSTPEQAGNERTGVMKYDVNGYYSSTFRKSYIIDNDTGLIYEIPEGLNLSILRGVAIDKELGPLNLELQEDRSLLVKPFVESSLIFIMGVFEDKYGQTYILNDSINQKEDNVIMYTHAGEYVPTDDGRVLHLSYGESNLGRYSDVKSISVIGQDFSENQLDLNEDIPIFYDTTSYSYNNVPISLHRYNEKNGYYHNSDYDSKYKCEAILLEIIDGIFYMMDSSSNNPSYAKLDLNTLDLYYYQLNRVNGHFCSTYIENGNVLTASKESGNNLYSIGWLSLSDIDKASEILGNHGKLTSTGITNLDSYIRPIISDINFSENALVNKTGLDVVLMKKSISGASTYRIVSTDNGYEAVESGIIEGTEYSIILQPINRV